MPAAIEMHRASIRTVEGITILDSVDWRVEAGERWAVLGANGSGKTSLLRLAGAERQPTTGQVCVLGHRLGRVDLRWLRSRLTFASPAVTQQLRDGLTARDAVMSAKNAALETWWHDYDDADRARAVELLAFMGCEAHADQPLGTLSQGERQRVLLARTLMASPELLLYDEPAAGLDLPAREALVDRLSVLAADPQAPTMVLVTHHVEEVPDGVTHGLLLRGGQVVSAGPLEESLTAATLSAAYGIDVHLERRDGRWFAWGRRP